MELFIWLRGPYRNVQIGRTCFENGTPEKESPLEYLLKKLPAKTTLCTSYPAIGSAGGDIEKKTWLNFFYHYEFRGSGRKDIEEGRGLWLRRPVGPRPARPRGCRRPPDTLDQPDGSTDRLNVSEFRVNR